MFLTASWLFVASIVCISLAFIKQFYVMVVCFMLFLSAGLCAGIISAISVALFPTNFRYLLFIHFQKSNPTNNSFHCEHSLERLPLRQSLMNVFNIECDVSNAVHMCLYPAMRTSYLMLKTYAHD